MASVQGGSERLRGQIGCELGIAAASPEVRGERAHVTAVEQREGLRLGAGAEQKLLVGARVMCLRTHYIVLRPAREVCDRGGLRGIDAVVRALDVGAQRSQRLADDA